LCPADCLQWEEVVAIARHDICDLMGTALIFKSKVSGTNEMKTHVWRIEKRTRKKNTMLKHVEKQHVTLGKLEEFLT